MAPRIHLCDVNPDTLAEMLKANPGMRATVTELVEPTDVEKCVQEATDWMGSIDDLFLRLVRGLEKWLRTLVGAAEEMKTRASISFLAVERIGEPRT